MKTNTQSLERVFAMSYYSTNQNRIPMYSQTGRVVGWISDNILQKNADSKKHMLHKPPGWAWDKTVIDRAIEMGVTRTVIHDKNTKTDYWANIKDFYSKGQMINRGFCDQLVLPLVFWEIPQYGEPIAEQLAFSFEGVD